MSYGIKVSKSGQDVKTATDKNLIVTSEYETFKIFSQGSVTVSITGSSDPIIGEQVVSHNLGYNPVFMLFWENIDGKFQQIPRDTYDAGGEGNRFYGYSDKSDLHIIVYQENINERAFDDSHNFKYYIFANSIEPIILGPLKDICYGDTNYGL